ncbi:hypothetical protein GCM10023162_21740 [Klenkia terrae]
MSRPGGIGTLVSCGAGKDGAGGVVGGGVVGGGGVVVVLLGAADGVDPQPVSAAPPARVRARKRRRSTVSRLRSDLPIPTA